MVHSTSASASTADQPRAVKRHDIRDAIQRLILEGEFTSGKRLGQRDLAQRFGVAQGLVREALLELQACGLVEIVDNRGVFVRQLDIPAIIEALQIRQMHEGLAARLCCQRTTRQDIDELRSISQQMHKLSKENKLSEMSWLDRQFHRRLLELSGNSMLVRLADSYLILGKAVRGGRDPDQVYAEHQALLQAIEDGQADQAEQLARQHIDLAQQSLRQQLEQGQTAPKWLGKQQ
ncbi:MAG: GntR family transcriptional regulator [Sedimentisphaerales bacterium]|nr:GntR family transcriptional regulator [Sedimentisphaerales bacterium]